MRFRRLHSGRVVGTLGSLTSPLSSLVILRLSSSSSSSSSSFVASPAAASETARSSGATGVTNHSNSYVSIEINEHSFPELFPFLAKRNKSSSLKTSSSSTSSPTDAGSANDPNAYVSVEIDNHSFPELYSPLKRGVAGSTPHYISRKSSTQSVPSSRKPSESTSFSTRKPPGLSAPFYRKSPPSAPPTSASHSYSAFDQASNAHAEFKLTPIRGPISRAAADRYRGSKLLSIDPSTFDTNTSPSANTNNHYIDQAKGVASYGWGFRGSTPFLIMPAKARFVYPLRLNRIDTVQTASLIPLDRVSLVDLDRKILHDSHMDPIIRAIVHEKFSSAKHKQAIIADAEALALLLLHLKDIYDGSFRKRIKTAGSRSFCLEMFKFDDRIFISTVNILPNFKPDREAFDRVRTITSNIIRRATYDQSLYNRSEIVTYQFQDLRMLVRYPVDLLIHNDSTTSTTAFLRVTNPKNKSQQQHLPVVAKANSPVSSSRLQFQPHPDQKANPNDLEAYRIEPYDEIWQDKLPYELYFSRLYRGYSIAPIAEVNEDLLLSWRPATSGSATWLNYFEQQNSLHLMKLSQLLHQFKKLDNGNYWIEFKENAFDVHRRKGDGPSLLEATLQDL
ncbi:hypothetical protein V1514DRAFT_337520 [Lipomyces japonicus]|uniref:uncharacterized protein n=1 Tax=Lipomyces japonicus TaxID=56871 RepID=UPI0034CEB8AB